MHPCSRLLRSLALRSLVLVPLAASAGPSPATTGERVPLDPGVAPTREFEIRGDRAYLGGAEVDLWGIRSGNALHSWTVTERHVRALDDMARHGVNFLGVYLQGSHGGWPDADAGLDGFRRDGSLKGDVGERLEWLVREADLRGMVVLVGILSPRKDQGLEDEEALKRAIQDTGRFLERRGLRNVLVDLVHEFDHTERMDLRALREPEGAAKKARLASWFREVSRDIECGVCPYEKSTTADEFPGMDVRIIQKSMPIPERGFVVNVETQKQDSYENDGVFTEGHVDFVLADCERFLAAPNAVMLFHAAYIQGIGNFSGSAPHPEVGGRGTSPSDRGVRFYYEWVRDHVGRWEYPRHVPATVEPAPEHQEPVATREFEVRDSLPCLGGEPVKLWGLRCNNALLSPAVTERLIHNLDNYVAHGINLVSVSLQGTNGGFPDVDAGPNAFAPDGKLVPSFARRLERVVREADARGMVVCVVVMMPRKDQLLEDEAAVRRAIEETGRLLERRKLRNVMVNLYQEFHHPTRIDHEIFREPDGEAKKARLAQWFKAEAPGIEVGIVPNHLNGSKVDFPGCDVQMFHEAMSIPESGFALNTETPDPDLPGNEGVINGFHLARLEETWSSYAGSPRVAMLFRSPYFEDVRGVQGTGPNLEMGGHGTGASDRGMRVYFDWVLANVGSWEYPRHVRIAR